MEQGKNSRIIRLPANRNARVSHQLLDTLHIVRLHPLHLIIGEFEEFRELFVHLDLLADIRSQWVLAFSHHVDRCFVLFHELIEVIEVFEVKDKFESHYHL